MKLTKDISLKTTSIIISGLESSFTIIIATLCVYCWLTKEVPYIFVYESKPGDTEKTRQRSLEGCVITWSLSILLTLCLWRIVSTMILLLAVKKELTVLLQYWIAYKGFVILISLFVAVVSFTASPLKASALLSLFTDFSTGNFIFILYPEIEKMEKGQQQDKKPNSIISNN